MSSGFVLVAVLLFFIILGTPIAISAGLATIAAMLYSGNTTALVAIVQKMMTSVDQFSLLALPLFVLSGMLMEVSGISERLVKFMRMLLRRVPASSPCITTVASAFFGALSGSAPATAAAIGGIMINKTKAVGYKSHEAAAVNACSASLGIIIPPSIPMVVFATCASASVGALFMGGVIPGMLLMLSFCVWHVIKFRKVEKRSEEKLSVKEAAKTFVDAIFALGMPVIILGGIYGGLFTPTEAAAVSCVYALVVACLCYRQLSLRQFWDCLWKTALSCSAMLVVICVVSAMAWYVSSSGIATKISNAVLASVNNKVLILTIINLILFVLGCFIDPTSIILLTCPIILPITNMLGMSQVAVGVMMVMNIGIGMVTPPFAITLYISAQLAGEKSIGKIAYVLLPYIAIMLVITLLCAYVPEIITWLPEALGMTV